MGFLLKTFKALVILLFLLVLAAAGYMVYFSDQVIEETASRIERGVIEDIISSESPVYYDDDQSPIGVFFDKTHRNYIHYEDIPRIFIKALIAAEDGGFFGHLGFDPKSILRAALANLRAGKVVQGGSTITQQTAKNVFKREKRSYRSKLKELVQALLLESKYTKEEILEMYSNQFFVTGFGKGLQIAAHYFFDKDAKELDLVEAAFIAGSVKGPNLYNPFIKKNEEEHEEARRLAKQRKDYVIQNMLNLNFITRSQFVEAKKREIPFKEGKITYRLNVILDYIREQLESEYFKEVLKEQGVENFATSGIHIFTSINKDIQEATLETVRRHLPLMDVMLKGYQPVQADPSDEAVLKKMHPGPEPALPFLARITQISPDRENPQLVVAWEKSSGVIDYEGLKPIGEAWLKWKLGTWAQFDKKHVGDFLKSLKPGDLVPVRFSSNSDDPSKIPSQVKVMLSSIPELQGSAVVLRDGMLKAMGGGIL